MHYNLVVGRLLLKRRHRELVKVGMERARMPGKRIGRPSVTQRDGSAERFGEVASEIGPGGLSLPEAARELDIGFANFKRLLDSGTASDASSGTSGAADSNLRHGGWSWSHTRRSRGE